MYRKYKWVLISLAIVCFSAGAVYGALNYYFQSTPDVPTPLDIVENDGLAPEPIREDSSDAINDPPQADSSLTATNDDESPPEIEETDRYVGVDGGEVVVYVGHPDKENIQQRTGMSTDGLPQFELQNLHEGIKVESDEQLSMILEGLSDS